MQTSDPKQAFEYATWRSQMIVLAIFIISVATIMCTAINGYWSFQRELIQRATHVTIDLPSMTVPIVPKSMRETKDGSR